MCTKSWRINLMFLPTVRQHLFFPEMDTYYSNNIRESSWSYRLQVFLQFKWSLSNSCIGFRSYRYTMKYFPIQFQYSYSKETEMFTKHQPLPLKLKMTLWLMSLITLKALFLSRMSNHIISGSSRSPIFSLSSHFVLIHLLDIQRISSKYIKQVYLNTSIPYKK